MDGSQTTITEHASVEALNALLRGELSAVSAYEVALGRLAAAAPTEMRSCLLSHQLRVQQLTTMIYELGGRPEGSNGAWPGFAVPRGLNFSMAAALGTIAAGEISGLAEYRKRIDELEPRYRPMVRETMYHEQQKTHDLIGRLVRSGP